MPCSPGLSPVPRDVRAIGVVVGNTDVMARLPSLPSSEVR